MAKKPGKFEREFTAYVGDYPFKTLARGIDEILHMLKKVIATQKTKKQRKVQR